MGRARNSQHRLDASAFGLFGSRHGLSAEEQQKLKRDNEQASPPPPARPTIDFLGPLQRRYPQWVGGQMLTAPQRTAAARFIGLQGYTETPTSFTIARTASNGPLGNGRVVHQQLSCSGTSYTNEHGITEDMLMVEIQDKNGDSVRLHLNDNDVQSYLTQIAANDVKYGETEQADISFMTRGGERVHNNQAHPVASGLVALRWKKSRLRKITPKLILTTQAAPGASPEDIEFVLNEDERRIVLGWLLHYADMH